MRANSTVSPSEGWADIARLASVAAVVVLHMAVGALAAQPAGSIEWWLANLFDSASRWSVPMLVTVSGFLLLAPERNLCASVFYRRRAVRILPALVVWSAFFVIWMRVMHTEIAPGWGELLGRLARGFPYYHMWFLYMLIGLYVVAPWLKRLCDRLDEQVDNRGWIVALGVAFTVAAAWQALIWIGGLRDTFWPLWFVRFIPFFLFGAWLRRHELRPPRKLTGTFLTAAISITALVYGLTANGDLAYWAGYVYSYASLPVMVMTFALAFLLEPAARSKRLSRVARRLRGLMFGVYLMHPVWIDLLQPIWRFLLAIHAVPAILGYALVVFVASLLSTWLFLRLPGLRRVVG